MNSKRPLKPQNDSASWQFTFVGGTSNAHHAGHEHFSSSLNSASEESMLLSMAHVGESLQIVGWVGDDYFAQHLTDLGIYPGLEVRVTSRTDRGSVVVAIQGIQLGLGAEIACRICVTRTEESQSP